MQNSIKITNRKNQNIPVANSKEIHIHAGDYDGDIPEKISDLIDDTSEHPIDLAKHATCADKIRVAEDKLVDPELVINKVREIVPEVEDDEHYPTVVAMKKYVEDKVSESTPTKLSDLKDDISVEKTINKIKEITKDSTDNQYPSAKAVKEYADSKDSSIKSAKDAADKAQADVDTIKSDYLKSSDKQALQDQINTIMDNPDTEGVINSIKEFTEYIEEDGQIAEGFRKDIDQNKSDIEEKIGIWESGKEYKVGDKVLSFYYQQYDDIGEVFYATSGVFFCKKDHTAPDVYCINVDEEFDNRWEYILLDAKRAEMDAKYNYIHETYARKDEVAPLIVYVTLDSDSNITSASASYNEMMSAYLEDGRNVYLFLRTEDDETLVGYPQAHQDDSLILSFFVNVGVQRVDITCDSSNNWSVGVETLARESDVPTKISDLVDDTSGDFSIRYANNAMYADRANQAEFANECATAQRDDTGNKFQEYYATKNELGNKDEYEYGIPQIEDKSVCEILSIVSEIANDASSTSNEANNKSDEAMTIAKGRATGYVFDTVEEMNGALSLNSFTSNLVLGDNLYIRATNVPDYWWDGSAAQPLETQKVDLTEYVKNTDYATEDKAGIIKVAKNSVYGVYSDANNLLRIYPASPTDIKNKTNNTRPITVNHLEYAVEVCTNQDINAELTEAQLKLPPSTQSVKDSIGNIESVLDSAIALCDSYLSWEVPV